MITEYFIEANVMKVWNIESWQGGGGNKEASHRSGVSQWVVHVGTHVCRNQTDTVNLYPRTKIIIIQLLDRWLILQDSPFLLQLVPLLMILPM